MVNAHDLLRLLGFGAILAASLTALFIQMPRAAFAAEESVATVEFKDRARRRASVDVFPGDLDAELRPKNEGAVLNRLRRSGYDVKPLGASFVGTTDECESGSNDVWGNLFSTDDRDLMRALGLEFLTQVIFSIYRHNCTRSGGEGILAVTPVGGTNPGLAFLSWAPPDRSGPGVDPFGGTGSGDVTPTRATADDSGGVRRDERPVDPTPSDDGASDDGSTSDCEHPENLTDDTLSASFGAEYLCGIDCDNPADSREGRVCALLGLGRDGGDTGDTDGGETPVCDNRRDTYGCGNTDSDGNPEPINMPASLSVPLSETKTLSPTAGEIVSFSTSNSNVSVVQRGNALLVTGESLGTATITASDGQNSDSTVVTVTEPPTVDPTPDTGPSFDTAEIEQCLASASNRREAYECFLQCMDSASSPEEEDECDNLVREALSS